MSCFDVYTLPSSCTVIQTYPSQVHPNHPGRSSGPQVSRTRGVHPRELVLPDDDEIAIALALLNL